MMMMIKSGCQDNPLPLTVDSLTVHTAICSLEMLKCTSLKMSVFLKVKATF